MGFVRATLFDFDITTNQPKEPLTVELEYDPEMSLADQGYKKISLTAGDNVGCGTVTFPLAMLMGIMQPLMEADAKRSGKGGIIMPGKPGIILPN